MRKVKFLLVALAATAGIALAGCQQIAEKAVEQTTGVKVGQNGDSVTLKGKDGETISINSETPAELKDFPMPAGFKLESSGSMSAGGDRLAVASYKGKGTLKQTTEFYQSKLTALGWKEESSMMADTGGLLSYSSTKDASNTLTLTVSKGDADALEVSVLFGKSKNTPVAASTPAALAAGKTESSGATPTAQSGSKPTEKPAATETPAPPKTTSASAIPAELQVIPIPSGFQPLKDGMIRLAEGGKFKAAMARFSGTASVHNTGASIQSALIAKGWEEGEFAESEEEIMAFYTNPKDNSTVTIVVSKADTGTELNLQLAAGQ